MPQLDKVTLFSQVFWLIFLYFFFFLIFLKYYLPKFSKLFKIRSYYLVNTIVSDNGTNIQGISYFSNILLKFNVFLKDNLIVILEQYNSILQLYNFTFLKKVNNLFIVIYVYNCLKFNLYKKLYL
jgi:ATP synthase subunit 8